jgi:Zn-dependent M28 family amino/carboxypeptidase
MSRSALALAALLSLVPLCAAAQPAATPAPAVKKEGYGLADKYREPAGALLGAALMDDEGWDKLVYLTTAIGHRLSGSKQLEEAIAWANARMNEEGLETRLQPVKVPHWVRGQESAEVVAPIKRKIAILGLGGSVGTPKEGIEAPVVVVESFEELEALDPAQVKGKIVAYCVPWMGYGKTVAYRGAGASRAAKMGAVAALVRSATGHSLSTPHTGAMRYAEGVPKIPAAAMTPETSEWLKQMKKLGKEVTVRLEMEAQTLPDADSANVIAEIRGSEKPEEVVVMGGHYDSWDVGHGAHDDGAPCMAAWQALRLVQKLGLKPKRTLRVVLWTNEENGVRGGEGYRAALSDTELRNHVAAIEMDGGMERPKQFGLSIKDLDPAKDPVYADAYGRLAEIATFFAGIEASRIETDGGGVDIGPLMREGVPGLSLETVGEHYFDWHHSEADTLDKVDKQDFRRAVGMLAVMGYVLADMPDRLAPVAPAAAAAGQ